MNQQNSTTQGYTNHNYTISNIILEHVCINSRHPPSIEYTIAKDSSYRKNNALHYDAQISVVPFYIMRNVSMSIFSMRIHAIRLEDKKYIEHASTMDA